jgi:hypothetical protein
LPSAIGEEAYLLIGKTGLYLLNRMSAAGGNLDNVSWRPRAFGNVKPKSGVSSLGGIRKLYC